MRKLVNEWLSIYNKLPAAKQFLLFAVFGALLIISAFILEYGFDARPCHLCWMQRYGHWALTAVAIIAAVIPQIPRFVGLGGVALAAIYGFGMGIYQVLVQYKIIAAPTGCSNTKIVIPDNVNDFITSLQKPILPPPCDRIDFTIFGLTLAAWNIIVMAFVLGAVYYTYRQWKHQ